MDLNLKNIEMGVSYVTNNITDFPFQNEYFTEHTKLSLQSQMQL